MKISGTTPPLPSVASQARSTRRPETDAPAEAPAPAPVPVPETSETEAPTESGKAHGLVRAAEHSHRSDVAALRQWINHPDLRSDLSLPELSSEHKGKGFEKAVTAYEAIIAIGNPPSTDPAPIPDPVVTDPAPVAIDPNPVVADPAPVITDPSPVLPDMAPVLSGPDPLLDALLPDSTTGEEV
jgi:hypothetical protein